MDQGLLPRVDLGIEQGHRSRLAGCRSPVRCSRRSRQRGCRGEEKDCRHTDLSEVETGLPAFDELRCRRNIAIHTLAPAVNQLSLQYLVRSDCSQPSSRELKWRERRGWRRAACCSGTMLATPSNFVKLLLERGNNYGNQISAIAPVGCKVGPVYRDYLRVADQFAIRTMHASARSISRSRYFLSNDSTLAVWDERSKARMISPA